MSRDPERTEAETRLMAALRATFDASVMNFGSYNILYAAAGPPTTTEDAGGESVHDQVSRAEHMLVGYRREPLEVALCPVDLDEVVQRAEQADPGTAVRASVPLSVNLTNLAGMAAEGSRLEIALSTGHHVVLDVHRRARFSCFGGVTIHQARDVEDFDVFVDELMDTVEQAQHGMRRT